MQMEDDENPRRQHSVDVVTARLTIERVALDEHHDEEHEVVQAEQKDAQDEVMLGFHSFGVPVVVHDVT